MNYLDLFSGIGGFALGARWAGMEFEKHYNSDIDDYANRVYAKHFPESIQLGDITKIKAEDLPDGEWIITGGFPCQNISCIGNKEGITGEKSILWYDYWRIIRDIQPRFAIIENVGQLIHRGLDEVLRSLSEIGYNAEWEVISAKQVGAIQKRERVWIIAYCESDGIQKRESFIKPEVNWKDPWIIEPDVGGMVYGLSDGVDRLKCLGNSIVPQIAEILFSRIKYLLEGEPRKASQS